MADEASSGFKCGTPGSGAGLIWIIGWLFTIGFSHLTFWKSVLALIIWPYFLGVTLR